MMATGCAVSSGGSNPYAGINRIRFLGCYLSNTGRKAGAAPR
ncbi:hypothetical protein [Morganella morganii IS15]|nr:hypothetical protein X965_17530 [Morganella sp. EGD-HP17]CDK67248.1 hypothetical protein [Morganella morganii IS15]